MDNIPLFEKTDIKNVIDKLKELGETAQTIKKFYPSTWGAICEQYNLDFGNKYISNQLFDKKIEITPLQDEERR